MTDLSVVNLYSLQINYRATDVISLPRYTGNIIRGLLGHSLKDLYCINPQEKNCFKCNEKDSCTFAQFFQGIISDKEKLPDRYKKFSNFPTMFSIEPLYFHENMLSFRMNFIGDIHNYFHIIINMLQNVSKFKPDKFSNARLELESVTQNDNVIYYQGKIITDELVKKELKNIESENILLHFYNPVRITYKGKHIMDDITGEILTYHIKERAEILLRLYCGKKQFPEISENALSIIDKRLKWVDLKHKSNRQRKTIKLGGFVGDIKVKIEDKNIIPYLRILELMHIGSNVKAGYGKFEILET